MIQMDIGQRLVDCGLLVLDSSYLKVDNGLGLRIVGAALAFGGYVNYFKPNMLFAFNHVIASGSAA